MYIYIIPLEWTYKQLIQINLQFIVNKIIYMSILVLISNKLMIFGITGAWEFICYMFTSNNKKYSAFIFKCIHIYYIYIFANIIIIFNINILLYMVMLDHGQLKLRPYFLPWVSKNRRYVSTIQSLFWILFTWILLFFLLKI